MEAAAENLAQGLKQLRKYGFVLVRTGEGDEHERHSMAEDAACLMLGLDRGTKTPGIAEVARTLLQNAVVPK